MSSSSETIPETIPAWEQTIITHTALSVLNLRTGGAHTLQSFEGARVTASLLAQDVEPVPPINKAEIVNINAGSIHSVQNESKKFTDVVQSLKDTSPNKDDWESKIEAATTATIQLFTERINAAKVEVIMTIKALPKGHRVAAADIYSGGLAIVNQVIGKVSDIIKSVVSSVKEFLQGVWNMVTKSWDGVKTLCASGLSTLGSMFGFMELATGGLTSSVAVQRFTGYVGWYANTGMGPVRAGFDDILDRLDENQSISLTLQQLSIEDVPQHGLCIIGRVSFGPKMATPEGVALIAKSLKETWDDAVNTVKKTHADPLSVSQQDWQNTLTGSPDISRDQEPPILAPGKITLRPNYNLKPKFNGNGATKQPAT